MATQTFPDPTASRPGASSAASVPSTTASSSFHSSVRTIDDTVAGRMTYSWRVSCPVSLEDLRYLTVAHWNLRGEVVDGELVVHADVADDVVSVFSRLFDEQFPIEQMRLVDEFAADDHESMLANNTSAFNCREVAGRPGVLSRHSYGTAIDINPRVNPWVGLGFVDPPESEVYADRGAQVPGGIYPGDPIVDAFRDIGWYWGGEWADSKDWQHFAAQG